jgi:DNA mismatch endonuclease (patch repair protein)
VQGCYWHQHSCKVGDRRPSTRIDYWIPRLRADARRDASNLNKIESEGCCRRDLWICEMKAFDSRRKIVANEYHKARNAANKTV